MSAAEFAALARRSAFFATLGQPQMDALAAASRRTTVARGGIVFLEGDAADGAYLIADGVVRMFVTEPDGTETTLRMAHDGELFGELAVIAGGHRAASAIVLRRSTMWRIPARALRDELPAEGSVGRAALHGLIDVIRANTRKAAIERAHGVADAVARTLGHEPQLLTRLSQGELAALIGISRQSLNKTLRDWERDGLLTRVDGRVEIIDPLAVLRAATPG